MKSLRALTSASSMLRVGYVPMSDCAPLIIASALGLFEKYGVKVRLSREAGWATIREKILHKELDAAHAHASMAFAIHCGIGVVPRACVTGLVFNLNGSAITLSNELWEMGVRDAAGLKKVIEQHRPRRRFSFAAVLQLSSQNYVLRSWLRSGGIDPDRDVHIPVIPSPLVHQNLTAGFIDGYCVGEPWSSILLTSGQAWSVATSGDIAPRHPEKIFLVLQQFARERPDEHLAMLAALIEACRYCDDLSHRPDLVSILAGPEYLDLPEPVVANCLLGRFETGRGRRSSDDLIIYHRYNANAPSRDKALWVYGQIEATGLARECPGFRRDVIRRIFQEGLYRKAARLAGIEAEEPRAAGRESLQGPIFESDTDFEGCSGLHRSAGRELSIAV